jgi:hypothetical protein
VSESTIDVAEQPDLPAADNSERLPIGTYDPYLSAYISLTVGVDDEHTDGTASITLTVPGAVVSGQIIARTVWAERLAKGAEASSPQAAKAMRELYGFFEEGLAEVPVGERERVHIHLRDAYVYQGTGSLPLHFDVWRGRLTEVSGWSPEGVRPEI